jgi:glycosyltransferase involved in cell wall biosynthesis
VRHYLRAEYGNLVLNLIRTRLATAVIYQSQFAKEWWERAEGQTGVPSQVIHNGVDLRTYTPRGSQKPPEDRLRVLMVEGSLAGGYEAGLASAVALAEGLQQLGQPVELQVVGHTQRADRQKWQSHSEVPIDWVGQVPRADIPSLDRGAHLLFSSDLNAACPNAVIEAMACGLPVVGFDTGALPELVPHMGGRLAGYGGDPWMLDPPDTEALVAAAVAVLKGGKTQRLTARGWAEHKFGLDDMVRDYLDVLDS